MVFDIYIKDSLKSATRSKRGKGVRRKVRSDSLLPGNWESFPRVDENKTELFSFLADEIVKMPSQRQIVITKGDSVVLNANVQNGNNLSPCNHEEADSRLFLHVSDAEQQGYSKVIVRTVDSDVVVNDVATACELEINELWVAFGVGKHMRYLPAHDIAHKLGQDKSKALLMFHAFTRCDQTSSFGNRGKKTAWETWNAFDEATAAFLTLSKAPSPECLLEVMPVIERFVVLMYSRDSPLMNVNEARKYLFTHKGRSIDLIPITADALLQHTKRASYQAGYVWGLMMHASPQLPDPSDWGWVKDPRNGWEPYWTSLPEASKSCRELLKCGCNPEKGCAGRCKCIKAAMPCTALCKCGGECERQ